MAAMLPMHEFLVFAAVGAAAQLVDGALGMAFGVASSALLLGLGMPPALASASVHYAETFTSGASGISHLAAGNVRWRLFLALALPGVIGAVIGAQLISRLPGNTMKLLLAPYLLLMGGLLLFRAVRGDGKREDVPRLTPPLGLAAGFLDTMGGGGWSALTVTTLVARGLVPRYVIGSTHLAKCLVSAAASVTFLLTLGQSRLLIVLGLIAGGAIAAPLGALFVRRVPARVIILLAGLAVFGLGMRNAAAAIH